MQTCQVDGQTVRVGDYVNFKSDVEQTGRIVQIRTNSFGKPELILESEYGFQGEYIGGETRTVERAVDCWLD